MPVHTVLLSSKLYQPDGVPVTLNNGEEVIITHGTVTDHRCIAQVIQEFANVSANVVPALQQNVSPVMSGSGEYGPWTGGWNGTYGGFYAFNRDTALSWLGARSSDPQWIAVDLGVQRAIKRVRVYKTNQGDNYAPNKLKIQYNSIGIGDIYADAVDMSVSGITYTGNYWDYTLPVAITGRYWKLYIIDGVNGPHDDGYGCGEFELYNEAGPPNYEVAVVGSYDSDAPFGVRRVDATTTKFRNQSGAVATIYPTMLVF